MGEVNEFGDTAIAEPPQNAVNEFGDREISSRNEFGDLEVNQTGENDQPEPQQEKRERLRAEQAAQELLPEQTESPSTLNKAAHGFWAGVFTGLKGLGTQVRLAMQSSVAPARQTPQLLMDVASHPAVFAEAQERGMDPLFIAQREIKAFDAKRLEEAGILGKTMEDFYGERAAQHQQVVEATPGHEGVAKVAMGVGSMAPIIMASPIPGGAVAEITAGSWADAYERALANFQAQGLNAAEAERRAKAVATETALWSAATFTVLPGVGGKVLGRGIPTATRQVVTDALLRTRSWRRRGRRWRKRWRRAGCRWEWMNCCGARWR